MRKLKTGKEVLEVAIKMRLIAEFFDRLLQKQKAV